MKKNHLFASGRAHKFASGKTTFQENKGLGFNNSSSVFYSKTAIRTGWKDGPGVKVTETEGNTKVEAGVFAHYDPIGGTITGKVEHQIDSGNASISAQGHLTVKKDQDSEYGGEIKCSMDY